MNPSDKVVWITGASSGIGEGLALVMAASHARLILSGRNEERLKAVCDRCAALTPEVHALPLDLSMPDSFGEKVLEAEERAGHVDILVNNAGLSQRSTALETPLAVTRRIMEVNFFGTVALTRTVLPSMIRRDRGQLVIISSVMGKFGAKIRSSYSASKHALHGYFDSLRAELYPGNITVSILCPGYVKTDVSINALSADGTPYGKMDPGQEKGISAEECALRLFRAIRADKEEAYIGGRECGGVYLKRFFPRLFSRIIRKMDVS